MTVDPFRKVSVRDLDVSGKRVFVRVDFNVPLEGGAVADDTRIRASLPTLEWILSRGGFPVLASHLGRPKGKIHPDYSLAPVAARLRELLPGKVAFAEDCVGDAAERSSRALSAGEVLLLENLRFHPGEEKNDPTFAAQLARLADAYVDDAFGSAHRAHASVAALCTHFHPAAAGLLMAREIEYLGRLLGSPARPYVAILGGAKVADKVALVKNLLPRVDAILIGGAMAYTFLAAQGISVGASRVEDASLGIAREILEGAAGSGIRLLLPVDHRVATSLENPGPGEAVDSASIPEGKIGLDIGEKTLQAFSREIRGARTVLWNGPVGLFEKPPFDRGSLGVAEAVVGSNALSVAGGGDTASALARFSLAQRFSHVSTGGGASLEFLSGITLPGVAALTDKR